MPCVVRPSGSCKRCGDKKQGCSLVPTNKSMGKVDCRNISSEELHKFRLDQARERRNAARSGVKKGKRRALDSSDPCESEGSALAPSPLAELTALGKLALDSAPSSTHSPSHSPATLPQAPLPQVCAAAPQPEPKNLDASGPSAGTLTSNISIFFSIFGRNYT